MRYILQFLFLSQIDDRDAVLPCVVHGVGGSSPARSGTLHRHHYDPPNVGSAFVHSSSRIFHGSIFTFIGRLFWISSHRSDILFRPALLSVFSQGSARISLTCEYCVRSFSIVCAAKVSSRRRQPRNNAHRHGSALSYRRFQPYGQLFLLPDLAMPRKTTGLFPSFCSPPS